MTRLLTAVVCALAVALTALAQDAPRTVASSGHYILKTAGEQAEADELLRVLEAAWPLYEEFFGAAPELKDGARLRIELHEDDASFRAAITAGGGVAPSSGGYYCPVARTAYLKRQPSRWYTRNLLLHEASHQFHYLSRTNNDAPHGSWYVEGIAEHLGSHTWDGETLRLGVTPLLSLEDRAGKALAEIAADGFSLGGLIEAPGASRPAAMFLLRYLRDGEGGKYRKKLDALSRKLDRGSKVDAKQFFRTFGKEQRLLAGLRAWLPTVQEPLTPVFVEWDARRADRVLGRAGVVATCRTRAPVTGISARLRPPAAGRFKAGLLLSHASADDYTVALFSGSNGVPSSFEVNRRRGGRWETLERGKVTIADVTPESGFLASAERKEAGVLLRVGGLALHTLDLPAGSLGLAVDNCEVTFDEIALTPAPE